MQFTEIAGNPGHAKALQGGIDSTGASMNDFPPWPSFLLSALQGNMEEEEEEEE